MVSDSPPSHSILRLDGEHSHLQLTQVLEYLSMVMVEGELSHACVVASCLPQLSITRTIASYVDVCAFE